MNNEPKGNPFNRSGPHPLPVHVGLAMAEYEYMKGSSQISEKDMEKMLTGIRKYQNHPYRRSMEPLPPVWREGEARIFYCAADEAAASVLLVPSLINKSSILDLMPGRSFVRWLAGQGIDAYLLDWGNPVEDSGLQDIDSMITERLGDAIEAMVYHAGEKIYALGYCMGGTLLAAAATHQKENLKGVIFLASPWDFNAGNLFLSTQIKFGSPAALQMIEKKGFLPKDWIQSVFAAVNAGRAVEKFSAFADLDDDSGRARLFVAVEDWLNDGVDLPGPLAKMCILDWYGANRPGKGGWEAGGKTVDPRTLDVPALVVTSENDRLVPKESSTALAELLPQAQMLEPSSGHIGMITGSRAEEQVWKPVAGWIKNG